MVWNPPQGVIPVDRKSPSAPTLGDIPAVLDWLRDYYPAHTVIGTFITARDQRLTYRVDGEPGYGTPGTLQNYTLTQMDWNRAEIDRALADLAQGQTQLLQAAGRIPWAGGDHTTLPNGAGDYLILRGGEAGHVWTRPADGAASYRNAGLEGINIDRLRFQTVESIGLAAGAVDGDTRHLSLGGMSGTFYWDAASTEAHNGGTVLRPATVAVNQAGRWVRSNREWGVHVKWFGAKGDGVTDDSAAINAAIQASRPGEAVNFGGAVYAVGTRVLYKGGRQYLGTNWDGTAGTVIKALPGVNLPALFLSDAYELDYVGAGALVLFQNMVFDGNKSSGATVGAGLWLFNYSSRVSQCHARNLTGDGFRLQGGPAFQAGAMTCVETGWRECRVYKVGGTAFNVVDPSNNKMTDGYITDCTIGGESGDPIGGHGIFVQAASGWKIHGNHTYQVYKNGIDLVGGDHCDVSHNYIESYGRELAGVAGATVSYYGIRLQGLLSSGGAKAAIISENRIFNDQTRSNNAFFGIYVRTSNLQTNVHIQVNGNFIRGNGSQYGIGLTNGTGGILRGCCANNAIENPGAGLEFSFGDGNQMRLENNTPQYRAAAPAWPYAPVGLRCYTTAPTTGGYVGWVCTATGAAPTFKQFGVVA